MEADWKKFREMVPMLRERYLSQINARITSILADPSKNETERFWDAFEVTQTESRVLRDCLNGHSRSNMWEFLHCMIGCGMLHKEDMAVFSQDLQAEFARVFERRERRDASAHEGS
jgi:hypothetical protein